MTEQTPASDEAPPQRAEPSLARSSRTMALGTVASRGTGFLRTLVLAAALGPGLLGDAYTVANTTPNIFYDLLLGGILTSVVVPLLVQATRDGDGEAYAQRLLSLVGVVLGAVTVVAVLAAPLVVALYGQGFTGAQRDLAVLFTRFFLPQIFFYGVGAVIGAILNTRGSFGAPMWAPVLNNAVVIVTGLLFIFVAPAASRTPDGLTGRATTVLALGTTLGIVAQTFALLPSLRAVGFRFRVRTDVRGVGLRRAGGLAKWVLVYVAANQIGLLVVINLAGAAARAARDAGDTASGNATYAYAFQLFQLPHAIVAVSVITALLPRMSRSAADGRLGDLVRDLSRGSRLGLAALVPAAMGLLVLHTQVGVLVFARGATSLDEARAIGLVMAAFAVGLVPFSLFQLQLRVFYALSDTRTPALVNIAVNLANIIVDLLLYAALPPRHRVAGLAMGYALSYVVGLAATSRILDRRLGGLDGRRVVRTGVRLLVSALAGGLLTALLAAVVGAVLGGGTLGAVVTLVVAGGAGAALFVLVARRTQVDEVHDLVSTVLSRAGR